MRTAVVGAVILGFAALGVNPTPATASVSSAAPTLSSVQVSGTTVTVTWTDNSTVEEGYVLIGDPAGSPLFHQLGELDGVDKVGTGRVMTLTDTITPGANKCYVVMPWDNLNLITAQNQFSNQMCIQPTPALPATPATGNGFITTVDTSIGRFSSVAIGTDGLPLISFLYADSTLGTRLGVAHCNDSECSSPTVTQYDSGTDSISGYDTSVKIGADGLGVISYRKFLNNGAGYLLRVAHCSNVACTGATINTVTTTSVFNTTDFYPTSMAISRNGFPLITYVDGSHVKLAQCENVLCSGVTATNILDMATTIDPAASANLDSSGKIGVLTYRTAEGVATAGFGCTGQTNTNHTCGAPAGAVTDTAGGHPGRDSSNAMGLDHLGLVSYATDSGLVVAHCESYFCTGTTTKLIDSGSFANTSITIGGDGLGVISYYDSVNKNLKVAHCSNLTCTSATTTVVDEFDDQGDDSSIAIGGDGLPFISYFDRTDLDLKIVHCPNVTCDGDIVTPF